MAQTLQDTNGAAITSCAPTKCWAHWHDGPSYPKRAGNRSFTLSRWGGAEAGLGSHVPCAVPRLDLAASLSRGVFGCTVLLMSWENSLSEAAVRAFPARRCWNRQGPGVGEPHSESRAPLVSFDGGGLPACLTQEELVSLLTFPPSLLPSCPLLPSFFPSAFCLFTQHAFTKHLLCTKHLS